jgi:hypothetical protein
MSLSSIWFLFYNNFDRPNVGYKPNIGYSIFNQKAMKQFILSVLAVICGLNTTIAQNKTYFGLEFSLFRDIHKIRDNSNYLTTLPLMEPQGGVTVRQEIQKRIFIEAGVIIKPYSDAIGFKPMAVSFIGTEGISLLIPIRFGLNLNVYEEKISLVPVIGYSYSANTPSSYGRDSGTQESSTTIITYTFTENPDVSRYVSLLQMGIGFEFQLFDVLLLSISTNYYKGYTPIWIPNINYTVNNSPSTTGTVTSKGDFWCVSTGLKYPISNFWTTKR